jgi:hypothetical protein
MYTGEALFALGYCAFFLGFALGGGLHALFKYG